MIVAAGEALVDLIARPDGALVPSRGGSPYNAARAIARLGVPAAWLGGLSRDAFGRWLGTGLAEDGVSVDLVQWTGLPTTLAVAELDGDGVADYRFYVDGTSAPEVLPGPMADGLPAGARAVVVGSLGLGLEPIGATLERLVAALPGDVLLMVDPNCRPSVTRDPDGYRARMARVLSRADVVKASVGDLAFLRPGESPAASAAWLAELGVRTVLVTDGPEPVRVTAGRAGHLVTVPAVRAVDTIGAGDTFGGAFLACLVHDGGGRSAAADTEAVLRAANFAVRASAFVCRRAGADPPTLAEMGGWPAA